jgi:hypothetical protein
VAKVGRENSLNEERVLFGEAVGAHSSEERREGDPRVQVGLWVSGSEEEAERRHRWGRRNLLLGEPREGDQLEVQVNHARFSVCQPAREVRRTPAGPLADRRIQLSSQLTAVR